MRKDHKNIKFGVYIAVAVTLLICICIAVLNTNSFRRELVDIKSDYVGLERTINVYTANGDLIASYSGRIDIDSSDGVVKFDYNGKRYIYYNCFVETIADIN